MTRGDHKRRAPTARVQVKRGLSAANRPAFDGYCSNIHLLFVLIAALGSLAATSTTVQGQYWWDGGGSGNSWGTAGNWGIGANNSTAPNPLVFDQNRIVVFNINGQNGSANSVTSTLDGARTINGIQFVSAGTVQINAGSGGPLRIWGGGITTGSGSGGTLTLNVNTELRANQSWDIGRTLIKENPTDLNANTLIVEGSGETQIRGAINGTGVLVKRGLGTLALRGTNTFSGGTQINNGILGANSGENFGSGYIAFGGGTLRMDGAVSAGNPVFMNAAGTIDTNNQNAALTGTLNGGGSLTKVGNGRLTFTGNPAAYSGTVFVNQGTFETFASTLPVSIANSANLSIVGGGFYGGAITGGGLVSKYEAGDLILAGGGNTFPQIDIHGGGLVGNTGSIRNHIAFINPGTNLVLQQEFSEPFNGFMTGPGAFVKQAGGEIDLTSANSHTGGTFLQGGRLVVSDSSQLGNGFVQFLGGGLKAKATFDLNRSLDMGTGGVIDTNGFNVFVSDQFFGTSALTKEGNGFLVLNNQNNSTFPINVNAGILQGTAASIRGPVSVASSAQLNFNQGTTGDFNSSISGGGSVAITGGGRVNLNVANSFNGGLSVVNSTVGANASSFGGGGITLNSGSMVISGSGNIFNNVAINGGNDINTQANITISGNVTGAGALTKSGAGNLNLWGFNSYSGGTTITQGTLTGDSASFGAGPITIANGATLAFQQNTSGTFSANIVGAGALTKSGAGNLNLWGFNSYSGGTTIAQGTLTGDSASFGTGPITIANGATLAFQQSTSGTFSANIVGAGALTKSGAGNLNLWGFNSYSGGMTIAQGTLTGDSASFGTGPITVASGASIIFQQNVNGAFSSPISGMGGLVKSGSGSLTLTGNNSYSGGTIINAGKLVNNGSVAGPVTITSNGTLGGGGTINGNVVSSGLVAPGNSPGILTINGDYMMNPDSVLEIEVGGLTPGIDHDLVQVTGTATLGGTVTFPLINGFVPNFNDEITFLTAASVVGSWSSKLTPLLPDNYGVQVIQTATAVRLKYVDATNITFTDTQGTVSWNTASSWFDGSVNRITDLPDRTTVQRNKVVDPTNPQIVVVDSTADTRQVLIADELNRGKIMVKVVNGQTLNAATGGVTIAHNAELHLGEGSGNMGIVSSLLPVVVQDSGILSGNGDVLNQVQLTNGEIHVGPGETLSLNNTLMVDTDSTIQFQIGSGGSFGHVDVVETAVLNGTIRVQFLDGYLPSGGDSFQLLTTGAGLVPGTDEFDMEDLPIMPPGAQLIVRYQPTTAPNSVVLYVADSDLVDDGVVNVADVDALVAALAAGTVDPRFDLNGDGMWNDADVNEWLRIAGETNLGPGRRFLPADANLDGTVDGSDFITWNTHKFVTHGTSAWSLGDFNADGTTDGADFILWNQNKFRSSDTVAAVPEPAAAIAVLLGMLVVSRVRRR